MPTCFRLSCISIVQVCSLCHGKDYDAKILLCDECDKGFHMFCLSPPLTAVPEGDWYCSDCLGRPLVRCPTSRNRLLSLSLSKLAERENVFGFDEGREFNLRCFKEFGEDFEQKWFGKGAVSEDEVIFIFIFSWVSADNVRLSSWNASFGRLWNAAIQK